MGTAIVPRRRQLWLAFLCGGFGLAMSAQINFLVPLRARELGASFDLIGLIIATGALTPALVSVPLGAMIDRLGPRRGFILGTCAAAGIAALFVIVTDYWWFLLLQPALGVARSLGWLASQSHITGLASDEMRPRLTGRFAFFSTGGQMIGPILIGAVAQFLGFRWSFLFLAGYAALFALLGLFLVDVNHPTAARARQGAGLRAALELLRLRGLQAALLLSFVRLWSAWVYTTFFPVYLVDSGLQPAVVGTVMATSGLVASLLGPTAGFWTRWMAQQTATAAGLACSAIALLLAPHVASIPVVYVVPVLVGIGIGLSLPLLLSIVADVAPADQRGVALGLRSMVNEVGATAAPALVGPLIAALGIVAGFTVGALVSAAILVAARVLFVLDSAGQK